jgi:phenylacetate-CoA ligase
MYDTLFKTVLNPFFETVIKRRSMLAHRRFLEESQWWPREKQLEFQWQELKALLARCYQHVPYWRDTFTSLNMRPEDIRTFDDFRRLPVTRKHDIRAHKDRMIADDHRGRLWSKLTACWKRGYAWAGCEDGMRQLWLWGVMLNKKSALREWKERIHYFVMRKQYFVSHGMDDGTKAACIRAMNRFRPDIVVAYTNPLFVLAQYVQQNGGLRSKPKAVITGAEKVYDVQRRVIEQAFGCEVFDTYGCREVMLIGAECKEHSGLHQNVENLVVEVLREDGSVASPGEQGELVVTDLHNFGMPLIRYANEDLAVPSERTSCPCGRTLPLLENVVGRTLDVIRTPEGKDVSGEFLATVMLDKMGIDRYRFTQERIDYMLCEMVKNSRYVDHEGQQIEAQVAKMIGPSMRVEYRFVTDIPVTRTGKFRLTVSLVKRP